MVAVDLGAWLYGWDGDADAQRTAGCGRDGVWEWEAWELEAGVAAYHQERLGKL
jgi:hypothetical protein